jgi:tetratricopeptide (TPR) repeat protein
MNLEKPRRQAERLTIRLHELIRKGQGDESDADEIRESLTEDLARLPVEERRLLNSLAGDLYMIANDERLAPAADQSPGAMRDAWKARDWKGVLALLAHDIPSVDPHFRAYLRGRAWGELGYPLAAAQFLRFAWQLQRDNENYGYLAVEALRGAGDFEAAWELAVEMLGDERAPATLLYKIADVLYAAAHRSDQPFQDRLYKRVIEVVNRARARAEQPSVRSVVVGGLVKKGFSLANLGKMPDAEEALSEALKVDHDSDIVLSARGLLRMDAGRVPEALVDFTRAVDKGTVLVWPFVYLAKHAIEEQEYERCLDLVAAALARTDAVPARANLLEWKAIALGALGRTDEALRIAGEAQLLEPFNDRIVKNVASMRRAAPVAQLEVVVDLTPKQAMRAAA